MMGPDGAVRRERAVIVTVPAHEGLAFQMGDEVLMVQAPCALTNHGEWGCITHELVMGSQLAQASHCRTPGPHLLVWLCHHHGPEQP